MKPHSSSEYDEQDRDIINLLEELGSIKSAYPSELLVARREAFLVRVDQLTADEELSAEDQEIVLLLGSLASVQAEYPPALRAARRSALLQQIEQAGPPSLWNKFRLSLQRFFQDNTANPMAPRPGFLRISLVIGSLIAAAFLGSLLFSRMEQAFQPPPLPAFTTPTSVSTPSLPTSTDEAAFLICEPDDPMPACPPGDLDPSQDLAQPENGAARPAVSNGGAQEAAYVNDGRMGASWVSTSPDSWIKIDLGQVRTINTVSLQSGMTGASDEETPGQFVIAVALTDSYADGDSSHDYMEYAQVFHSEQTGFSGMVSQAETIRTQFSPVRARYVKITFEKAGAAIEKVGVFMVEPPVLAEQPTRTPQEGVPGSLLTVVQTNTVFLVDTATSAPTGARLPTDTAVPPSTDTPTPLPTHTLPPADTATPVPTEPLPSPTVAPPTAIPPTVSAEPIIVAGSNQILTFTCNGNAVEVRGHANTITLLGSCSSITVKGNGNLVLWQSGSPVIVNKGKDNIIRQM